MIPRSIPVSIVVVTWNGEPWIEDCLRSVVQQPECDQIIIIDNGSDDATVSKAESVLKSRDDIVTRVVPLETNTGFTAGANRGLALALASEHDVDGIFLLNQDTIVGADCLQKLSLSLREHPEAGALGTKTLYPDGRIQHAGGFLDGVRMVGRHYGHHEVDDGRNFNTCRELEWATGAAIMLRPSALEEAGLFNEVFSPGYYEDVELCRRLRTLGWKVLFVPEARILHHESASFKNREARYRLSNRNRFIYLLPHLANSEFVDEFLAAEREFLIRPAFHEEVRAIGGAAIDVLVNLPAIARHRLNQEADPQTIIRNTREVLNQIRQICLHTLSTARPSWTDAR